MTTTIRGLVHSAAILLAGIPVNAATSRWPEWAPTEIPDSASTLVAGHGAVVLLAETRIEVGSRGRKARERRVIAFRTAESLEEAKLRLVDSELHDVSAVRAWLRRPDGEIRLYEREDAVALQGRSTAILDDTRFLLLWPHGVVPGAVLAFEHRWKSPPEHPQDLLRLEESIPTLRRVVEVRLEDGWEVRGAAAPGPTPAPHPSADGLRWVFESLPGRDAPGAYGAPAPPRRSMTLAYSGKGQSFRMSSWSEASRWGEGIFGRAMGDPAAVSEWWRERLAGASDPVDAAFRVAREQRYFAIEIGWGGYVPRSPSVSARRGLGDCKDKATLLVALLRLSGVEAFPVLAVAPEDGFVHEALPSPFVFNHAIVGVPWTGRERRAGMTVVDLPGLGPTRFVDATLDPYSSVDLAVRMAGGWVLPLVPSGSGLFRLPETRAEDSTESIEARAILREGGGAEVRWRRGLHGSARVDLEHRDGGTLDAAEIEEKLAPWIYEHCPSAEGLDFDPPEMNAETWTHEARWTCPDVVAPFGEADLLELPSWIAPIRLTPIVPASDGPDVLPPPRTVRETWLIETRGRALVTLPADFLYESEAGIVKVTAERTPEGIVVRREYSTRLSLLPPEARPAARAFDRAWAKAAILRVVLGRASEAGEEKPR